jgi:probable phosphoglycerate mutase
MSSGLRWILVRHGDTEWTEKKKLHGGRFDSPLSSRGRKQAELTGQALKDENIQSIFSSPQGRALQTAEIIGGSVGINQIQPVEGFRELNFGLLEGRPILTFGLDGNAPKVLKPLTTIVRNLTGESKSRFIERVSESVAHLQKHQHTGQILVVAHWGVLSAIMASLFNGDANHWLENVKWSPCGITKIQKNQGRWELLQQDHTDHLVGMRN